LGTITEKFEGDNFSSISLDDSTAVIKAKVFEQPEFFSSFKVGDLVVVIGKVKEFAEEIYLQAEAVRKISEPNYETFRKLEILNFLREKMRIASELKKSNFSLEDLRNLAQEEFGLDEESLSVVLESKKMEIDYKPKILEVIQDLDKGEGVEISKLVGVLNLPENVIEGALNDLLASGMLYEPVVGKLRRVEV